MCLPLLPQNLLKLSSSSAWLSVQDPEGGTQQPPGAEACLTDVPKCSKQPHKQPNVEPLQRCCYSDSQHQPQQRKRNQNQTQNRALIWTQKSFIFAGVVFPGCGSDLGSHEADRDQCRCWHRDDKHQLGPGPEWIVTAGAPAAEQRQIQKDRGVSPSPWKFWS